MRRMRIQGDGGRGVPRRSRTTSCFWKTTARASGASHQGKLRTDNEAKTRDAKSLRQTGISMRLDFGPHPDYRIAKWAHEPRDGCRVLRPDASQSSVERIVCFRTQPRSFGNCSTIATRPSPLSSTCPKSPRLCARSVSTKQVHSPAVSWKRLASQSSTCGALRRPRVSSTRASPLPGIGSRFERDAPSAFRRDDQHRPYSLAGIDAVRVRRQQKEHGQTGCLSQQLVPIALRHVASIPETGHLDAPILAPTLR